MFIAALKETHGKFFLNGHWKLGASAQTLRRAGSVVDYRRTGDHETITIDGPISASIDVMVTRCDVTRVDFFQITELVDK